MPSPSRGTGCKAIDREKAWLGDYLLRFLELQQESHAFSIKGHRVQGDRSREGVARRER